MSHIEKTIDSTRIFEGKVVRLRRDTVELENGKQIFREVIDHPGGVSILAMDEEGKIFFVRQFRYPYQEVIPEIPAGKLTPGEDPLECGKRELQEETGAAAARYEFLGKLYPSPGYCGEIIYMYMATGLTYGEMNPDEDEFLEVERIPLEKAAAMVLDGTITDAKTQAAVLKVYIKAKG